MEKERTPEEIEEKKKALEAKKKKHRVSSALKSAGRQVKRKLKIAAIAGIGLAGGPNTISAGNGFTLTPVSEVPGTHTQATPRQAPDQTPQQVIYGSVEWAIQQGYTHYDARLSMGLNRRGTVDRYGQIDHNGYLGAYINPYTREVAILPNDPIHDKPKTMSIGEAEAFKKHKTGPYKRSNIGMFGRGVYRHGGWRY